MLSQERVNMFEGYPTSSHEARKAAHQLFPDGCIMPYKLGVLCKETPWRGPWVAQQVEGLTLVFDSGHDPGVMESSAAMGFTLSGESAGDSFLLPLPPFIVLSLSLLSLYLS